MSPAFKMDSGKFLTWCENAEEKKQANKNETIKTKKCPQFQHLIIN